jgi:D-glycero-alpha-D-manno-heptose-7-phosphate kinase
MGPLTTIRSSAPTRICDMGGWTDTWFAEHGTVFSIAIEPRVHVELTAFADDGSRPPVVIEAKVFGDRYAPDGIDDGRWGLHPLLEATIAEVGRPAGTAIEIVIDSDAPYGASIGTSAATCVGLVAALDRLTPGTMTPDEIARTAWRVETDQLGQQSGVQDQLAAAHGGVNLIRIERYPDATVEHLDVPASVLAEFERRVLVVYLGAPHRSTTLHETVIAELVDRGPTAAPLAALRTTAEPSARAMEAGDFEALGRAMIANTEAQRTLHRDLVGALAERVIEVADRHGVVGHKVNGAGGDGGAITLLTNGGAEAERQRLIEEVVEIGHGCAVLPVRFSADGVRVDGMTRDAP